MKGACNLSSKVKKAILLPAKVVGTAVLIVTGTASTIMKTVATNTGAELFEEGKQASFNGIRAMWKSEKAGHSVDKANKLSRDTERFIKDQMADTAKRAAEMAKQYGDVEKEKKYTRVSNKIKR